MVFSSPEERGLFHTPDIDWPGWSDSPRAN
jgi:hypothetical protein